MNCAQCGSVIPEGATSCPSCGHLVDPTPTLASLPATRFDPITPDGLASATIANLQQKEEARYSSQKGEKANKLFGKIVLSVITVIPLLWILLVDGIGSAIGLIIFWIFPVLLIARYLVKNLPKYSNAAADERAWHITLAARHAWSFFGFSDVIRARAFAKSYPSLFNLDRSMFENQYWGETEGVGFWFTKFSYEKGSGKSREYISRFVQSVSLTHEVACPFYLTPHSTLDNLIAHHLQTESEDFSRRFDIQFEDTKSVEHSDIFQTLTPVVMEAAINLQQSYGDLSILFTGKLVLICLETVPNAIQTHFLPGQAQPTQQDEERLVELVQTVVRFAKSLPC